MKNNHDLSNEKTVARQNEMMLALRRTGLGKYIKAELPEILLSPRFCQFRARDCRRRLHSKALRELRQVSDGRALLFVTWVPPEGLRKAPLECTLLKRMVAASYAVGALATVAVSEFDYEVKEESWRETVHAVLCVSADADGEAISKGLSRSLGGKTFGMPHVYRPVVVKPVTDLEGVISYAFKNFAPLSTTQRVVWRDEDGTARTAKQSLKPAQLKQLLKQIARNGPGRNYVIETFEQVA